jgi:hypothetical protein
MGRVIMNSLLSNRDGFVVPADGWYQVAPLGEFAHAQAGLIQVVDAEACAAMVNRFADEAKGANFAGLLVDFDHFSLDGEKRSEAAGWITALENRDGGLFAKIRWSDVGEEAVKGGRYRFLSPVWSRGDCVDLGNGRVRPVRLLNAAVTNDPNLKGMRPLSNRGQETGDRGQEMANVQHPTSNIQRPSGDGGTIANAGGEQRFKWVLGETEGGRHCPSCAAVAGQVHTMAEWDAAGVKPGADGLFCQGNCQCRLEATDEGAGGVLMNVPMRNRVLGRVNSERSAVSSGESGRVSSQQSAVTSGERAQRGEVLANVGWMEEARVASLAVRRAKAAARAGSGTGSGAARPESVVVRSGSARGSAAARQAESLEKASRDYSAIFEEKGLGGMSAEEVSYLKARIGKRVENGSELTETEKRFVREVAGEGAPGTGDGSDDFDPVQAGVEGADGFDPVSDDGLDPRTAGRRDVQAQVEQAKQALRAQKGARGPASSETSPRHGPASSETSPRHGPASSETSPRRGPAPSETTSRRAPAPLETTPRRAPGAPGVRAVVARDKVVRRAAVAAAAKKKAEDAGAKDGKKGGGETAPVKGSGDAKGAPVQRTLPVVPPKGSEPPKGAPVKREFVGASKGSESWVLPQEPPKNGKPPVNLVPGKGVGTRGSGAVWGRTWLTKKGK